ncbi:MAG: hypothetical protein J3K34DRAFT_470553 [Monoraphidium minutum]|nr:MAG: hypothetical protein J3K34DRAFT_470553 [Monoraphidium minutum]
MSRRAITIALIVLLALGSAAAARPAPAAAAPARGALGALVRRALGALARPWDARTGMDLAMLSTQAAIGNAAGSADHYTTYSAARGAAQRTQMASYGWYGFDGHWRRH